MTRDEQQSVERFRARLGLLFLLKYMLTSLTVWAFLYGTATLALRGSLGLARLTAAGAASRSPGRASIPAPAAARSVRA